MVVLSLLQIQFKAAIKEAKLIWEVRLSTQIIGSSTMVFSVIIPTITLGTGPSFTLNTALEQVTKAIGQIQ